MANVVLFHHVRGLSDGMIALADQLRTAGHDVVTPDLFEGRRFASPPSEFADAWPVDVPVQIHGMSGDPFFAGEGDIDNARAIVASVPEGVAELFEYPGDHHLFVDGSLPAHDPSAATLVVERVLSFLAGIDARRG